MGRVSVTISQKDNAQQIGFETPDIAAALVVAEMNLDGGIAELREGERKLATLRRCDGNGGGAAVWIVSR